MKSEKDSPEQEKASPEERCIVTESARLAAFRHDAAQPIGIIRLATETVLAWADVGNFDIDRIREKLIAIRKQAERLEELIERCDEPGPKTGSIGNDKSEKSPVEGAVAPQVLIVDDEHLAAEALAEYLESKGYRTSTCANGVEALDFLSRKHCDVVITDVRMPAMGGDELIRRIRPSWPTLPIIVTTGHVVLDDALESEYDQAVRVLRKPVRLRELGSILEDLKRPPRP